MPTISFKGKTFVQNHHLNVKFHELIPNAAYSKTNKVSLHDNLVIEGDNLKALKALLPTYSSKVKAAVIDPPYNTSNEKWVYNDNVNSPMMQEWLGEVVNKDDLTRHDKWLCMMMPRLKLLRELLSDDGVIFAFIDDDEQHRLRMLMDEIFGPQNFIATLVWQKKFAPQNDKKYFSDSHDFIICYAKNKVEGEVKHGWIRNLLPRTELTNSRFENPDNDPRGPWASSDLTVKTYSAEYDYPITTPSGRIVNPSRGRCWSMPESEFLKLVKDKRIWFGVSGSAVPRNKTFLSEVQDGVVPMTILLHQDVGHNQQAKQELKEIFNESAAPFDTPKPVLLIKHILKIATGPNDIVIDSFAGSGTTAHATLALNKEDGGNRKFILIEMEDYANELTAERLRRVIKGIPGARTQNLKTELGGSFSYFTLGNPIEMEELLQGNTLPSYENLSRYVYYTATGEEFDATQINEETNYIGSSQDYDVYLFYKPDLDYLKSTALTLELAEQLGVSTGKKRLVFAPMRYLDQEYLHRYNIEFSQLPFEIYRLKG